MGTLCAKEAPPFQGGVGVVIWIDHSYFHRDGIRVEVRDYFIL